MIEMKENQRDDYNSWTSLRRFLWNGESQTAIDPVIFRNTTKAEPRRESLSRLALSYYIIQPLRCFPVPFFPRGDAGVRSESCRFRFVHFCSSLHRWTGYGGTRISTSLIFWIWTSKNQNVIASHVRLTFIQQTPLMSRTYTQSASVILWWCNLCRRLWTLNSVEGYNIVFTERAELKS